MALINHTECIALIAAAMVLGLIYGMVDHTYFFDLLILYGVMAAKFAVMFAVTWAISRAFREKMKPREKVEQNTVRLAVVTWLSKIVKSCSYNSATVQ